MDLAARPRCPGKFAARVTRPARSLCHVARRARQRLHLRLPRYLQSQRHASMTAASSRCAARTRCPIRPGSSATRWRATWSAFVHGPQRLLHPLRRVGPKGSGQFERISWDAALDEIHERVSEVIGRWGPQAVMPLNYAGPHGLLAGDSMSLRFFNRLGATPALPARPVRRGAQRSLGRAPMARCPDARPNSPSTPSSTSSGATTRPSPTCISCAASARPSAPAAGWSSSTRCAPRSPSRRICICRLLPGTERLLAWALAAELERAGRSTRRSLPPHVLGSEEFMARAREWPAARAAAVCGVAGEPDPDPRALAGRSRPAGARAGQRARARPQRRQRHPRGDRAAGAARQARPRQRHRARRQQRLSQDAGANCSGRI